MKDDSGYYGYAFPLLLLIKFNIDFGFAQFTDCNDYFDSFSIIMIII